MSLHSHTNVQWAADITREIILQHKRYAPLKCDTLQNVVKFSYIFAGYTNRWLALDKKTALLFFLHSRSYQKKVGVQICLNRRKTYFF
jgi:hypothetical protein